MLASKVVAEEVTKLVVLLATEDVAEQDTYENMPELVNEVVSELAEKKT